jgi:hypothetical protein
MLEKHEKSAILYENLFIIYSAVPLVQSLADIVRLKDRVTRFFTAGFFMNHLPLTPHSQFFPFRFSGKMCENVCNNIQKLITGVVDTGRKFTAGVTDTGGHIFPTL